MLFIMKLVIYLLFGSVTQGMWFAYLEPKLSHFSWVDDEGSLWITSILLAIIWPITFPIFLGQLIVTKYLEKSKGDSDES